MTLEVDSEKVIREQLSKNGFVEVKELESRYCGISFVGGVHAVFVHPLLGVVAGFDFETQEFEVGESFGKHPARHAKEDALDKEVHRARLVFVLTDESDLERIRYLESKVDVMAHTACFEYDYYDNQESGRERANTHRDLFHVIGDIPTLAPFKLLPRRCGSYPLLNANEMNCLCTADAEADALYKKRLDVLFDKFPALFEPPPAEPAPLTPAPSATSLPQAGPEQEPEPETAPLKSKSKSVPATKKIAKKRR